MRYRSPSCTQTARTSPSNPELTDACSSTTSTVFHLVLPSIQMCPVTTLKLLSTEQMQLQADALPDGNETQTAQVRVHHLNQWSANKL